MSTSNSYRPDIDGLRALAVVSVVVFHFFPNMLKGGFVGVDIFFVISGFLITSIIWVKAEKQSFSLASFYSRRIRRLFPALITVLIFVLTVGWLLLFSQEYINLGKHVAWGASFLANVGYWMEVGYFDSSVEIKPLLHLWSLGVEEHFYLVWPIIFMVFKTKKSIVSIIAVMTICSFASCLYFTYVAPGAGFYISVFRFWELSMGGVLALIPSSVRKNCSRVVLDILSLIGLSTLLVAIFVINKQMLFPGWIALLPVLSTCLLIFSGPTSIVNRSVFSFKSCVGIGLISYPLYLWHWPLFSFSYIYEGSMPNREVRVALVFVSIILAFLTYQIIEKKVRFNESKWNVTALVLIMLALLSIGILVKSEIIKPKNQSAMVENAFVASSDWTYPLRLTGHKLNNQTYYTYGEGRNTVMFIGDSHMEQWVERITKVIPSDYKAVFYTLGGCVPISSVTENKHPHCSNFLKHSKELFEQYKPKKVVVGAYWNQYLNIVKPDLRYQYKIGLNGDNLLLSEYEGRLALLDQMSVVIDWFIRKGSEVVIVLDNPSGPIYDPLEGTSKKRGWFEESDMASVSFVSRDIYQLEITEALKNALGAKVEFIDPAEALCDSYGHCALKDNDGLPIYKDKNHLRSTWVGRNADFIDSVFD